MARKFKTSIDDAVEPFVMGLDVGSTASRGGLYDARGLPISGYKHRVPHTFEVDTDGKSVIDAEQVVAEMRQVLDMCARPEMAGKIAGVAMDTFSASLVGVGADGIAVTPCYTYADSRCSSWVLKLREEFDEAEIQQRTGTRFHNSYLLPRFLWLRETDPDLFGRVDKWMALGEYVYLRLAGQAIIGTAAASWTGLLDRRTGEWDTALLDYCGVRVEQMGDIRDPDQPMTPDPELIGKSWPGLVGARWFGVIADGLASNIGAGAPDSRTMAMSAATSGAMRVILSSIPDEIPPGLWCYRVDRNRSILGGAINDVGRAVTWLEETLAYPNEPLMGTADDDTSAQNIDANNLVLEPPKPGTPLVLPFFTGERSTGWAAGAKAMILDVTAATKARELYRGTMEGVALTYVRVAKQLIAASGNYPSEIRSSGRITQDLPGWQAVLADALDVPILPITMKRTTLHGTVLLALETLAPNVAWEDVLLGDRFEPSEEHHKHYEDAYNRFEKAYEVLI